MPARTRTGAVFSLSSLAAIWSAVRKPMPRMSRARLDDIEHGITEGPHQLSGVDRPDPADHPGAEIFLDPLGRRRRGRLKERSSELDAMGSVVDPASTRLHELAGRHH